MPYGVVDEGEGAVDAPAAAGRALDAPFPGFPAGAGFVCLPPAVVDVAAVAVGAFGSESGVTVGGSAVAGVVTLVLEVPAGSA
jgi:hypothetical protein